MVTPQLPHALGKVRVKVAVVDRVARRLVAIAGTPEVNLVGVAGTGSNPLGIDVVGIVIVRIKQPLVVVQVEDVLFSGSRMDIAEFDKITGVTVVHIGWIGWKQ